MAASGSTGRPMARHVDGGRRWPKPWVRPLLVAMVCGVWAYGCASLLRASEASRAEECRASGRLWHDSALVGGECWDR